MQAVLQQHGSVVDVVPGARELLERGARREGGAWQRCKSMEQLAEAVGCVRRQQRCWWGVHRRRRGGVGAAAGGCREEHEEREEDGGLGLKDWLPWVYDVMGVRGSECREMLDSSADSCGIWLLRSGSCAAGSAPPTAADEGASNGSCRFSVSSDADADDVTTEWDAVVVVGHSKLFRRMAAGVVVASPDHIAPCAALAASRGPHFMCFIDQGARYEGHPAEGADPAAWPELYRACAAPTSNFYVYVNPVC